MPARRRILLLLILASTAILLNSVLRLHTRLSWRNPLSIHDVPVPTDKAPQNEAVVALTTDEPFQPTTFAAAFHNIPATAPAIPRGTPKPKGAPYSRALVVAAKKEDNVTWVYEDVKEHYIPYVYVVDDPQAKPRVIKNKGNEGMAYLTWIISHYQDKNFPDIVVFSHSHRRAWHNNEVLDLDAVEHLERLSAAHVVEYGYVNLRCSWNPGCPAWLHPLELEIDPAGKIPNIERTEEVLIGRAWRELFPLTTVPSVLSQPCCAQFAVSKERIHAIGLDTYISMRDWLLRTKLSNYHSGRIMEYTWQWIFAKTAELCPHEHVCYCKTYGVCFQNEAAYDTYIDTYNEHNEWYEELNKMRKEQGQEQPQTDRADWLFTEGDPRSEPAPELRPKRVLPMLEGETREVALEREISRLQKMLAEKKEAALLPSGNQP